MLNKQEREKHSFHLQEFRNWQVSCERERDYCRERENRFFKREKKNIEKYL